MRSLGIVISLKNGDINHRLVILKKPYWVSARRHIYTASAAVRQLMSATPCLGGIDVQMFMCLYENRYA